MRVKFYGVRGSIATPGEGTLRYGGNTSCVSLRTDDGNLFIFDAGTGIKKLGDELMQEASKENIYLLFSHYHWDHIQGFPFFLPAYQKNQTINLIAAHLDEKETQSVLTQMIDPHFPIPADELKAKVVSVTLEKGKSKIGGAAISSKLLNHPGGGSAYRVDFASKSMAYITDNELFPPGEPNTPYEEWVDFVRDVDILIHDAMYLDNELAKIHGWGHSLISQTLQLAVDAKVKKLILFHHDPSRTDEQLDEIQGKSGDWMKKINPNCEVIVAKEGDEYFL